MIDPKAPSPGGLPDFIDPLRVAIVNDEIWKSLATPKGRRVYVSTQDDWWDLIAIRVYGRVRGNEHLMYRLLEENYPLREVAEFPGGLAVIVPDVPVTSEIPLVPWKKATTLPTTGMLP